MSFEKTNTTPFQLNSLFIITAMKNIQIINDPMYNSPFTRTVMTGIKLYKCTKLKNFCLG